MVTLEPYVWRFYRAWIKAGRPKAIVKPHLTVRWLFTKLAEADRRNRETNHDHNA